MTFQKLPDNTTASNVLELVIDMIATAVAAKIANPSRRYYTAADKPTGEKWATIVARAKANGVPTVRQGREVHVDAAAWDAWVAGKATKRPTLSEGDTAALAALGLKVPR